MSLQAFLAAQRAEIDSARFWYAVHLHRYTWAGTGDMPWVYRRLKRWVGESDVRSVPIDWAELVRKLRRSGYTGKIPRSLRLYEPPPDDFVKPWPEWPGDPPWRVAP